MSSKENKHQPISGCRLLGKMAQIISKWHKSFAQKKSARDSNLVCKLQKSNFFKNQQKKLLKKIFYFLLVLCILLVFLS